ncbi:hypothetical protein PR202_gb06023 [Eleusine coracana subsp. coracana]|uniref:Peptidase M14 domain-containing protein n=1 Tax=Eleusine coracana subsp. coracana TaxID=191504 RepID=A0AAV5E988_ELECO|nr:hypothetical protein PR202_gb06023 [Eleusine coracana subsp. coracana]
MAGLASSSSSPPPSPNPGLRRLLHRSPVFAYLLLIFLLVSDSLLHEIKDLVGRHPDKLSMDTIQASNKGYSAELFVVTFNQVKESADNGSKVHVLLMVPMENFNGANVSKMESFVIGEMVILLLRRGVDLNRNWSVDWGKKEKDYDPYEENPGSAPFSEPEAQIMRDLSSSFKPHIWVNVHSGMEALFMPYDHKNTTPNGASAHLMRYFAHGTTTDYMYDIGKVPMPYTFEIYGDETASNSDCFKMFNPVDKTTFEVCKSWSLLCKVTFSIPENQEGIGWSSAARVIDLDMKRLYPWEDCACLT